MFRKTVFISTGFICLLNIILWPVNKYEWMLEEDPGMSLPIDGNANIYALFAIAPTFVLLLFLLKSKHKYESVTIAVVFIMLFTVWLYRYGETVFFSL